MKKVCTFIYCKSKILSPETVELIFASQAIAHQIGATVTAFVLGNKLQDKLFELNDYYLDEIIFADHYLFEYYHLEIFRSQLIQMIRCQQDIELILFSNDVIGKELAGCLSIDLQTNIIEGAFDIQIVNGVTTCKKFVYSNRRILTIACEKKPVIFTLLPHSVDDPVQLKKSDKDCLLIESNIYVSEKDLYSTIIEQDISQISNISNAPIVISMGNGISDTGNMGINNLENVGLKLAFRLSSLLNGVVGASRSIVDEGFIDYEHQVGLSGKIVAPDLYIACGISGSIQHLAGMINSKIIIAINTDPHAPIFAYSHYGVIGNLFEILPAMIKIFEAELEIKGLP
jgi:electron transfer flavoprotein alpha subunit